MGMNEDNYSYYMSCLLSGNSNTGTVPQSSNDNICSEQEQAIVFAAVLNNLDECNTGDNVCHCLLTMQKSDKEKLKDIDCIVEWIDEDKTVSETLKHCQLVKGLIIGGIVAGVIISIISCVCCCYCAKCCCFEYRRKEVGGVTHVQP